MTPKPVMIIAAYAVKKPEYYTALLECIRIRTALLEKKPGLLIARYFSADNKMSIVGTMLWQGRMLYEISRDDHVVEKFWQDSVILCSFATESVAKEELSIDKIHSLVII